MTRTFLAALFAGLCGCATVSPEKKTEPPAAAAVDFAALAAREFAPLPKRPLAFSDRGLHAEAECSAEPGVGLAEGAVSLELPVGTAAPIVCFIYREPIDAGATLTSLVALVGRSGKLQQVRPGEIVAIADDPALFLEADYLFESAEGPLAGRLKAMVFVHASHSLVCMHDEYGYGASFKRVVLALARSLEGGAPAAPSRYGELQLLEVNGYPLGFQRLRIHDTAEGGTLVESVNTRIIPRSATELVVEDSARTSVSDAAGRVVSLAAARSRNGEIQLQMEVQLQSGNTYAYQGTHSGKALSGTFVTRDPAGLPSDLLVAARVRELLLDSGRTELAFEGYEPSANPVAPIEATLSRSAAGPRSLVLTLGETILECRADERGLIESSQMRLGALIIGHRRLFQRGAP